MATIPSINTLSVFIFPSFFLTWEMPSHAIEMTQWHLEDLCMLLLVVN